MDALDAGGVGCHVAVLIVVGVEPDRGGELANVPLNEMARDPPRLPV